MRFSPLLQYLEREPGGEVSESPDNNKKSLWKGIFLHFVYPPDGGGKTGGGPTLGGKTGIRGNVGIVTQRLGLPGITKASGHGFVGSTGNRPCGSGVTSMTTTSGVTSTPTTEDVMMSGATSGGDVTTSVIISGAEGAGMAISGGGGVLPAESSKSIAIIHSSMAFSP